MAVFALVDCNNFFVSCERVFRPSLSTKSVVVLSNNDGCVVSRSNEAKAAGIPMGAPLFKYKDLIQTTNTTVFSANFSMYGDFSQRVMKVLAEFGQIEIYSIDEAFLDLSHVNPKQLYQFGLEISQTVLKHTGIPVSVGIAETKTLAKLANEIAKKDNRSNNQFGGVFNFLSPGLDVDRYLQETNVEDIWGIGYRGARTLSKEKIFNAKDLKYANPEWIKSNMKIIGLKTVKELNNVSCLNLETVINMKKGIASTRSFGKNVESLEELREAVAHYIAIASSKLRKEKAVASYLYVFIMTNRFHKLTYYYGSEGVKLTTATSYTSDLVNLGHQLLDKIYKAGYKYKKAGVYLTGLAPENQVQMDIFDYNPEQLAKKKSAIATLDKIQRKFGQSGLKLASQGTKYAWSMNSDFRSPRYTTNWHELPKVRI